MPIISAHGVGALREDCELKASLDDIARPSLKKPKSKNKNLKDLKFFFQNI
jgi:hypothetical protein